MKMQMIRNLTPTSYLSIFMSIVVSLTFSLAFVSTPKVVSLTGECDEERLRGLGVIVVNCTGDNVCRPNSNTPTSGILPQGSSVYILGDSITNQSRDSVSSAFETEGYEISSINADPGRAITKDTAGDDPTGLEAVNEDLPIIRESDAVVVALGTNSGIEDLSKEIPNLILAIRDGGGFTGHIYWVNLFYTDGTGPELRNAAITEQSSTYNYNVIDTTSAEIELAADGIHPTVAGSQQFAETIAKGVKETQVTSQVHPNDDGLCSCSAGGNTGPSINTGITWGEGVWGDGSEKYVSGEPGPYTVELWAIHVLKNIARKAGVPESQLVTENKVVSMIAWAKAEGGAVDGHNGTFNPLNTKSQYSDIESGNQGNASTDSNSQGYTTFDDGVEAITRGLFNGYQKRIGSALLDPNFPQEALIEAVAGDFVAIPYGSSNYSDVVNRLEDIYPGDLVYAALSITGFDYGGGIGDRELFVSIKRDTLNSVRNDYPAYAGKILDGSPEGEAPALVYGPSGGGTVPSNANCTNPEQGGGNVNTDGYSFPMEPQNRSIGGIIVGQTETMHSGDNTPAFDLIGPNGNAGGEKVYAISDGVVESIGIQEENWCYSIQFRSIDTYYYWYGHLNNLVVSEGQSVSSGDVLGEVAEWTSSHTCNGTSGTSHLHIDRGCVIDGIPQTGGRDECRDPEFIPFLSAIYEGLPQ